jgi:phosphate transport system substrate-binding protein
MLLMFALSSCLNTEQEDKERKSAPSNTTITIDGSDTMAGLINALSQRFTDEHKKIAVSIMSTDSGDGLAKLFRRETDIAATSRDLTDDETRTAAASGLKVQKMMIARDAIAVIVNPKNPLSDLTMPDLKAIYLGEKTNWKQFGGTDRKITVFAREPESGTSRYFKMHVLKSQNYPATDQILRSQDEVIKRVQNDPYAIGYVGMVESRDAGSKIKVVQLKFANSASPGVKPSKETLVSDYPLSRPLYLVFAVEPNRATKLFTEFCTRRTAKKIISDAGFVAIE